MFKFRHINELKTFLDLPARFPEPPRALFSLTETARRRFVFERATTADREAVGAAGGEKKT
jgi:hypothetical protein